MNTNAYMLNFATLFFEFVFFFLLSYALEKTIPIHISTVLYGDIQLCVYFLEDPTDVKGKCS